MLFSKERSSADPRAARLSRLSARASRSVATGPGVAYSKRHVRFFWLLLGQWFGSGRSPKAPGTAGSLATLPLFFLLKDHEALYWIVTALICTGGIFISQKCSEILGDKDPPSVVIDETAGVLLAMGAVMSGPAWAWALAFGLFRLLDITKPSLIDRAQYLPPAGLGIMADDILAGILAGALTFGAVQATAAMF